MEAERAARERYGCWGADGIWGSAAAGCHSREGIPVPRQPTVGPQGPHLHARLELESIRPPLPGGHHAPDQLAPRAPAEMGVPHGTALFFVGLGVGWTDRQTEIFSRRLVTD